VVTGSMMRQNIDQRQFKPRCYLLDTDTSEIAPIFYDVADFVFNIPSKVLKDDTDLDKLVLSMKESSGGKNTYRRDCLDMAEKDVQVKEIIEGVFDDLS